MKNPAWSKEELMLALELYLSKDTAWHNSISNSTPEVIALSEILQNLDIFEDEFDNTFRSTNSVRLKFANFKAVDDRYTKSAMVNIGKQDLQVWNEYNLDYERLFSECKEILNNHYKGTPSDYVLDYLNRFSLESPKIPTINYNDYLSNIYSLTTDLATQLRLDNTDLGRQLLSSCDTILHALDSYVTNNKQFKEHSGVNLRPLNSKSSKIGKYVQTQIKELINSNLITPNILTNLRDAKWSKEHFHLNHPFVIEFDPTVSLKEQGKDQFGYYRYWKTPFEINNKEYLFCKEWFEPQRKYFDAWLDTFKLKIKGKDLKRLLQKIKKLDEKNISIQVEDLLSDFADISNISNIIDILIKRNILAAFQGSKREIIVDDYELLYEMIDNTGDYVENE